MSKITCTNCGSQYDTTDTTPMYHFESSTFPQGSYASPSDISGEGEDMTFCPRCPNKILTSLTESMGGGEQKDRERGSEEKETAGPGNADVVFGGS